MPSLKEIWKFIRNPWPNDYMIVVRLPQPMDFTLVDTRNKREHTRTLEGFWIVTPEQTYVLLFGATHDEVRYLEAVSSLVEEED